MTIPTPRRPFSSLRYMLSEPTYLTARMVAPMIEAHFARHRAASAEDAARLAFTPEAQVGRSRN